MRYVRLVLLMLSMALLGCGGGGSSAPKKYAYVTVLGGYIVDADISDSDNTPVKYINNKKDPHFNQYKFYTPPKGRIKVSKGRFQYSGLPNKMEFNVPAKTKVISPLVVFLNRYPNTLKPLKLSLKTSETKLKDDYIKNSDLQIAKLDQIIYALSIHNLDGLFANYIYDAKNYSDIILAALKASEGAIKQKELQQFIYALRRQTDVKNLELYIRDEKLVIQKDINSTPTPKNDTNTSIKQAKEDKKVSTTFRLNGLDYSITAMLKWKKNVNENSTANFPLTIETKHINLSIPQTYANDNLSIKIVTIPSNSIVKELKTQANKNIILPIQDDYRPPFQGSVPNGNLPPMPPMF